MFGGSRVFTGGRRSVDRAVLSCEEGSQQQNIVDLLGQTGYAMLWLSADQEIIGTKYF